MTDMNRQLRQAVRNKRLSLVATRRDESPAASDTQRASAILRWLLDPTNTQKTQMAKDAIAHTGKEK